MFDLPRYIRSGRPNLGGREDLQATKHCPRVTSYRQADYPLVFSSCCHINLSQYCLLVLFHEATLQLLLWRSGERRSPNLLSQDDEERLRLIGLAKSEERAWVEEITRMREMKTRRNHRSSPRPRAVVNTSSRGRTLRPRKPPDASIR